MGCFLVRSSSRLKFEGQISEKAVLKESRVSSRLKYERQISEKIVLKKGSISSRLKYEGAIIKIKIKSGLRRVISHQGFHYIKNTVSSGGLSTL